MIEMQMSNDDLLHIFNLMTRRLNGSVQLMGSLIPDSGENVR